jgi:hypothetical protein
MPEARALLRTRLDKFPFGYRDRVMSLCLENAFKSPLPPFAKGGFGEIDAFGMSHGKFTSPLSSKAIASAYMPRFRDP